MRGWVAKYEHAPSRHQSSQARRLAMGGEYFGEDVDKKSLDKYINQAILKTDFIIAYSDSS